MNPNNPSSRHSGEGRNPVIKNNLRSRQNHDVVPPAWEIVHHLDTGLRRYDAVFANGFFVMKLLAALILLCIASAAQANPFADGNAQAGEKLFNQYKCNSCHSAMLGGDGSAIFTRADRKVHNANELIEQIKFCSGNVGAHLTTQQEQHLGAYLNRYYQLQ